MAKFVKTVNGRKYNVILLISQDNIIKVNGIREVQFRQTIMKKAISIFFTFLFLFTFGQKNNGYTLYHNNILKTEECNSRGSFDSSIVLYWDIFSKYDRVLARDAYNACQIAALQNHKYFSDFLFLCAKSGITKTKLLSNRLIKSKFITDSVKLNTLFIKGSKDYFKRIDTTLRREMIQRSDNEQKKKGKKNTLKFATIISIEF
jgi:hypothetical protein